MYCSEECRNNEGLRHHNVEFDDFYSTALDKSMKMQREAFRIAGGVDELLELLDHRDKNIFDFDFSSPDDPRYEKYKLMALNGLWKNMKVKAINPDQLLDKPPINESPRTAEQRQMLLEFILDQYKICCQNIDQVTPGCEGIFLLKSLLNHSCLPNVRPFQFGEKIALVVVRPVKRGDQIFVSYGALASAHPKETRLVMLRSLPSPFNCDCEACVFNYPCKFPRKDPSFVKPKDGNYTITEAIKQFKSNCKYIDKNAENMPSYEVSRLIDHNVFLVSYFAAN